MHKSSVRSYVEESYFELNCAIHFKCHFFGPKIWYRLYAATSTTLLWGQKLKNTTLGWIARFISKCFVLPKIFTIGFLQCENLNSWFLCKNTPFWVNRVIHLKVTQIGQKKVVMSTDHVHLTCKILMKNENVEVNCTIHFKVLQSCPNFFCSLYRLCTALLCKVLLKNDTFGVNCMIHFKVPKIKWNLWCALYITCVYPICSYFQSSISHFKQNSTIVLCQEIFEMLFCHFCAHFLDGILIFYLGNE